MIELLPETSGNLIAVRMAGTITEEEQDEYFGKVEAIFARERVEHMLMDWTDLDGWDKGTRSTGTWFGMHHRALVGRVAIVADETWADESQRIADIFHAATVRRFPPSARSQAIEWVRQG
ncbi:MAG: STAS/SEC14 domain-containing protein [Rhodospirillales bacterium]|nr:STAS/SEC14 domain-containing protein [Rhodospirillales bacterium]